MPSLKWKLLLWSVHLLTRVKLNTVSTNHRPAKMTGQHTYINTYIHTFWIYGERERVLLTKTPLGFVDYFMSLIYCTIYPCNASHPLCYISMCRVWHIAQHSLGKGKEKTHLGWALANSARGCSNVAWLFYPCNRATGLIFCVDYILPCIILQESLSWAFLCSTYMIHASLDSCNDYSWVKLNCCKWSETLKNQ